MCRNQTDFYIIIKIKDILNYNKPIVDKIISKTEKFLKWFINETTVLPQKQMG